MAIEWTPELDEWLRQEYLTSKDRVGMALRLGTTKRGLYCRAHRLGLFSRPDWCVPDAIVGQPDLPIAPEPTHHRPGSEGKIQVMRWRSENGYCVFHPEDA